MRMENGRKQAATSDQSNYLGAIPSMIRQRQADTTIDDYLRIMQYNVNKSKTITHSILNDDTTKDFTLILVQEPPRLRHNRLPPLHQSWTLIESTTRSNDPPRTAIYINNRKLPPASFEHIPISHGDITAISIAPNPPQIKPTLIINIYNSHEQTLPGTIHTHLTRDVHLPDYGATIIAGDFNLHHPLWNPPGYLDQDPEAEILIEAMMRMDFRPLLPAGSITFPLRNNSGGTAIDLVWGNEEAENLIIKCHTITNQNDHGSDHLPIEIVLEAAPKTITPTNPPYNFAKTSLDLLKSILQPSLPLILLDPHPTPDELDNYAETLTKAIWNALDKTTHRKKLTPHSKRWWTPHLSETRRVVNNARNRYRRTNNEADQMEWKAYRRRYKEEMEQAQKRKWKEFLEEVDEKTIWIVKKYIDNPPSPHYIPAINLATSNEAKAREFAKAFFPPPPPANLTDISTATYPQPVLCPQTITPHQVLHAINRLSPKKAPGPDEITNRVLKSTIDIILPHLHALAQASINIGHFPTPFKTTTTVILRKPTKPDYTKPNAYRPIALKNTLGKVIESIMAETLSYLAETHQLLPSQHYGGRPGRTGEDAMVLLEEKITHAWKEEDVYSVVFMDVAGAFNNVHRKRLLYDLRKRRIPEFIVRWVESFLSDRTMHLRFNRIDSERIQIEAGVPQGSSISPILYLFYNADLLEIPGSMEAPERRRSSWGFIDDIAYPTQRLSMNNSGEWLSTRDHM